MTVFAETTEQPNSLEALVGEGKKYKDVAELAKAYQHLDIFAENLKRENAETREELGKRLSVEEQVRALANQRAEQPPAITTPPVQTTPEPVKAITDEDLVARIREVQQKDSLAQRAQTNAQAVESRLITTFGDETKANDFVNQKASELGVSVAFLLDAAKTSPTGFYKLVDLQAEPTPSPSASRSDVNTSALPATHVKPNTKAYYDNLRRQDLKLYLSPRIQNQMMKDILANRDAFYN